MPPGRNGPTASVGGRTRSRSGTTAVRSTMRFQTIGRMAGPGIEFRSKAPSRHCRHETAFGGSAGELLRWDWGEGRIENLIGTQWFLVAEELRRLQRILHLFLLHQAIGADVHDELL